MGGKVSKRYQNKEKQTRLYLFKKSDRCGVCGKSFDRLKDATLDHIVPKSKGGGNELTNLQLAHAECNYKKGDT